jgi:hypothetical protein
MDPRDVLRARLFPNVTPGDYIGAALALEIEDFRIQTYDRFTNLHVLVRPVDYARPVYDINGAWVGSLNYSFDPWAHQRMVMSVRVSRSGRPKIWYLQEWRYVCSLLQNLLPPPAYSNLDEPATPETLKLRWENQARWWLANGKKFPLLNLPAEIRDKIYGYAFEDKIEPYPTARARRLGLAQQAVMKKKLNFGLLLTCKKVYQETNNVLFLKTPFLVEHPAILRRLTDDNIVRPRICQLEIAFSHDEFLLLFREHIILPTGEISHSQSPAALALKSMQLSCLKLTITAPSDTTVNGLDPDACNKVEMKFLQHAAWPFVRGQPVELGGYVKTSQKLAFEGKCKAIREDFQTWKKGNIAAGQCEGSWDEYLYEVDHDGGVLLNKPNGAFNDEECHCTVRCTSGRWDPDD